MDRDLMEFPLMKLSSPAFASSKLSVLPLIFGLWSRLYVRAGVYNFWTLEDVAIVTEKCFGNVCRGSASQTISIFSSDHRQRTELISLFNSFSKGPQIFDKCILFPRRDVSTLTLIPPSCKLHRSVPQLNSDLQSPAVANGNLYFQVSI